MTTHNLIWTLTTFSDRTSYLAVNGRKGVYELRGRRTPGTLDTTVAVYLNDKLLVDDCIGYDDGASHAETHEQADLVSAPELKHMEVMAYANAYLMGTKLDDNEIAGFIAKQGAELEKHGNSPEGRMARMYLQGYGAVLMARRIGPHKVADMPVKFEVAR